MSMSKIAASITMLLFTFSVASADDFFASIKKVDGNKVTLVKFKGFKKGEKGAGEEVTLTASAKVNVVKGKFNKETKKVEAGKAIDAGLKSEVFASGSTRARVTVDADGNITDIVVMKSKNKGKKKQPPSTVSAE